MSEKEQAYEPWVEDPDEPEEEMTEEQLKQFAEGAARLLAKPKRPEDSRD